MATCKCGNTRFKTKRKRTGKGWKVAVFECRKCGEETKAILR